MKITADKVTRSNARALKETLMQAAAGGETVLDFAAVAEADSSAVALTLSWVRAVQAKGGTPQVLNVPAKMVSLMRLYGVWDLLKGFCSQRASETAAK